MSDEPDVVIESFPGPRGINASTARRWFARASADGHAAEAWGATRRAAERKAVRWAKDRARKYRRRVV